MARENNELKAGVILSYISLFVENIIPLFYTPWMLAVMGQSEYGLYNLSHSVIGYLSLLSIGLGSSIIKFLSDKIVADDRQGVNRLTGLFTIVYSIISFISLICGCVLAVNAQTFFGKSLTASEVATLRILLILSSVNMAATFLITVYNALIIAHQKYIFNKGLGLVATLVTPCANVLVLLSGSRSIGLVSVATACTLIFGALKIWYCFAHLKIRPQFRNIDFSPLKTILKYSFFIFLAEISNMMYWATDKVLLGAYCGTVLVSVYSLGASLNTYYCAFSTAISNVMFPKVNAMVQKKASDAELSNLLIQVGRIQYLLMCLITTGFVLFGRQFIVLLWGGPAYEAAYYVALLTMLPSLVPLIQNVGLSIIQAKAIHQFRTVCFLIIAIVNIIFSRLLVEKYGLLGCAIPTCVAYLVGQGIAMNWFYWKKVNLDIGKFWKNIARMTLPILPLAIGTAIMLWIRPIENVITLLFEIGVYCVLYGLLCWLFVMNAYEKNLVGKIFKPVLQVIHRRF